MVENIAKSYSEVDVILSKLDRRYYNKISKGFLNYININEDKEYKTYFVNNENSINISKYTQTLLALVYRTYFCDEEQRAEYDNILNNNQIRFDEEQRENMMWSIYFNKEEQVVIFLKNQYKKICK